MQRASVRLSVVSLLFAACGGGSDPGPSLYTPPWVHAGDAGEILEHGDAGALQGGGNPSTGGGQQGGSVGGGSNMGGSNTGSDQDAGSGQAGGSGSGQPGTDPTIPAPGMACPDLKSGTQTIMGLETVIIAGTPSANKTGPLLIYWHGTGSSPQLELGTMYSGYGALIPKAVQDEITSQGGMIVAPHSPSKGTRDGTDVTGGQVWFTTHDYAFADLITACAVQNYGVDPRRVYTTGCSAGGLMAGRMSLEHGSYLAASSGNSGGLTTPFGVTIGSTIPPVMLMYGTASGELSGFDTFASNLASQVVKSGHIAIVCPHPQGHCQAPAELETAAWQFMKDHPFGIAQSPYATSGLPSSFPSYCKLMK